MVQIKKVSSDDPCLEEDIDYISGLSVLRPAPPFIKLGGDMMVSDIDNDSGGFCKTGGIKKIVWSSTPPISRGLLYCHGTELDAISFVPISENIMLREVL